jgi:hypothetical protein
MLETKTFRALLVVAAVSAIGSASLADTINLVSTRDNTLYDDPTGALSNGAGQFFFVGDTAAGLRRRALVRFDLSGIPAGATITNVTLTLHMSMAAGGATDVSAFRVLSDWGEGASVAAGNGGAGAPAATGDATWLHTFFNTSLWATPGGDFAASSSATTSVNGVASYNWSSAGLLGDVQQWISTPSSNFGWILRGDEVALSTSKRFDTRENTTASFRPALTIDYIPLPAPGAMTVLLGGLLLQPRRRRS